MPSPNPNQNNLPGGSPNAGKPTRTIDNRKEAGAPKMIQIQCPFCRASEDAPEVEAKSRRYCNKCGKEFRAVYSK